MSILDRECHVGGIFRLGRKIGKGSFGAIHLGTNMHNGAEVAIKLESLQSKPPQLAYEYKAVLESLMYIGSGGRKISMCWLWTYLVQV